MKYRVSVTVECLEENGRTRTAQREIELIGTPMKSPLMGATHLSIDVSQQNRFLRIMAEECASEAIGN